MDTLIKKAHLFQKNREKTGGRTKGTLNKATILKNSILEENKELTKKALAAILHSIIVSERVRLERLNINSLFDMEKDKKKFLVSEKVLSSFLKVLS